MKNSFCWHFVEILLKLSCHQFFQPGVFATWYSKADYYFSSLVFFFFSFFFFTSYSKTVLLLLEIGAAPKSSFEK